MTCIEYISELPCSLAFICVQDISEKEERMVRGYPQVLCLLGLLGQSVSAMKILFPFCLKVASSPGFSAILSAITHPSLLPDLSPFLLSFFIGCFWFQPLQFGHIPAVLGAFQVSYIPLRLWSALNRA